MTDTVTDSRVDTYIDSLPEWQQDVCRKVRAIVHAADPEVTETIKRTRQPYFLLPGNICALLAAKDHVNVFLYDPLVPDPEGIITASYQNNGPSQSVTVKRSTRALITMFQVIIVAHNRAGAWRKLEREA